MYHKQVRLRSSQAKVSHQHQHAFCCSLRMQGTGQLLLQVPLPSRALTCFGILLLLVCGQAQTRRTFQLGCYTVMLAVACVVDT